MKKVFDQTVRDLKREVNKKVLKVPGIEQKVLDATSNEPWGPHGSLLADIAQATRNYHEYQMIMAVIWKRINDTGKNWRHVYKALTVLEYLVAHGSERVIDDIKEHGYQISTLSDFQYIDSSGRDQGNNVRKKSQSLVVLVNDKERIIEVRQKAAANRDKFRSPSAGGMYRPGSYGDRYDDERYEGRYGSRDEDQNGYGYGREREYGSRDDDRNGRYGDPYNREDRYGRDYDYNRDDDYRGRSQSIDGYGSRSRSSDRDRDRTFDDDGQYSSRGCGTRADDQSQDGSVTRPMERKYSEQNIGAPPCYEEAVSESRSPSYNERNGETSVASAPGASSPPAPKAASPSASNIQQTTTAFNTFEPAAGQEADVVDEFDPRGPAAAASAAPSAKVAPAASTVPTATVAPTASAIPNTPSNAEVDLLGSLSDVFAPNPLAIMPVTSAPSADVEENFPASAFSATQSASNPMNQAFEDPFGDSPFKALPSDDNFSAQQQSFPPSQPITNQNAGIPPSAAPKADTVDNFGFGDAPSGISYSAPSVQSSSTNSQFLPQELSASDQETDILAGILPPSTPSPAVASLGSFPVGQTEQPGASMYGNFNSQLGSAAPISSNMGPQAPQFSGGNYLPQAGTMAPFPPNMAPQMPAGQSIQFNNGNLIPQQESASQVVSQNAPQTVSSPVPQPNNGNFTPQQGPAGPAAAYQTPTGPAAYQTPTGPAAYQTPTGPPAYQTPTGPVHNNSDMLGGLFSQGSSTTVASQPGVSSSAGPLAAVPQPAKDKFETKSTVWADTLSRGLVNLNISGPKINPLADIGIDFDAINRKEKRMEKPNTSTVTSTITMGKAMGSGSGMGRAGTTSLRPPSNPMMGSGMGMGAGMGMGGPPGLAMGMGGYGGMNQPMGINMGMGMGMNMGMGQGGQMRPPMGLPPGAGMPGGYNPMMNAGGYNQQPYGGGYR